MTPAQVPRRIVAGACRGLTRKIALVAAVTVMAAACTNDGPTPTPAPTATPTPLPDAVVTPTPTPTPGPGTPRGTDRFPESVPTATSEPTATPEPTATATPTPVPEGTPTMSPELIAAATQGLSWMTDVTNFGWPRQVAPESGIVTIPNKPERIVVTSLGHAEIVYSLVAPDRVVAAPEAVSDPARSNVAGLASGVPSAGSTGEDIAAHDPDLVISGSPRGPDATGPLGGTDAPVLETELADTANGRISDILLVGYALGEEQRAMRLANEVGRRVTELRNVWGDIPEAQRPRVLALSGTADRPLAWGSGAPGDSVIQLAGGVNAATEAGLNGTVPVSVSEIREINPDFIIVAHAGDMQTDSLAHALRDDDRLSGLAAIREDGLHALPAQWVATRTFWSVRGAEMLAKTLWPDRTAGMEWGGFSQP